MNVSVRVSGGCVYIGNSLETFLNDEKTSLNFLSSKKKEGFWIESFIKFVG